jgi:outer membrane protein assembly factor BamA/autotransporter translocation and assembly factor TamB
MRFVELARRRPWLTVLGGAAILGFVSLALLQAPPVRARILAWVASRLEPSGIVLRADDLQYDLSRLEIRIRGLTLATPTAPAEPFLSANEVHAVFGWGVLAGRIDVRVFELTHPRVTLVRTADGTSNWPSEGGVQPPGRAYDIHFGRVRVPDLDIVWRDAVAGLNAELSGLSIDLTPAGADTAGPLRLGGPAHVQWNNRDARISSLAARLSWNSRDLSIDALDLVLAEGRLRLDGRVQTLTGDPQVDLRILADSDLAAVAPWLTLDRRLTGLVHVEATITGPPSALNAAIAAKGREIGFDDLAGIQVETSGRISENVADLTSLNARFAGGSATGRGRVAVSGGTGAIKLEWQQLDLATLLRSMAGPNMGPQPAALASGWLDAQWEAPRLETLRVRSESRFTPLETSSGSGKGRHGQARIRLPLDGSLSVDVDRERLSLRAETAVIVDGTQAGEPSTDLRPRAVIEAASRLDARDLLRSPLSGALQVNAPDLPGIARFLKRIGLVDAAALTGGGAQGAFALAGTIGNPRLDGSVDAHDVRYAGVSPATLHTRLAVTRTDLRLEDVRGRLSASSVEGGLRLNIPSGRISGRFDAALTGIGELATALKLPVPMDGTFDARAIISGSISSPHIAGAIAANGLAAGQQIDRLDADVRLDDRVLAIDHLCLSANADTPPSLANSHDCRLEARGMVDLARQTYVVHAAAAGLPIRPVSGVDKSVLLPLATTLSGEIDGDGSFTNLGGRGRLTLADTRWDVVDVGRIEADLVAAGRSVSGDISAPALAFTATGAVGVDRDGPVAIKGRWNPEDIAAIAQRFAWSPPIPVSGSASLGIDVAGRRDRPQDMHVTADLDQLKLDVDTQAVQLEGPARVEYDGRVVRARDLRVTTGGSMLTIAGSIGEPASPGLTAVLRGSLADLAFVQRFAQSTTRSPQSGIGMGVTGSIDFRVDAAGTLERPGLSGTLRVADGHFPVTPQHAISGDVTARYVSGVLTIEHLRAAFQGATLEASGRIPADLFRDRLPARWREIVPQSGGPADLTMRIASVTPEVAAPFLAPSTLEQLQASVDASVSLQADRADMERVTGTVTLDRANLSISGVSFDQQRPTRLVVRNGRLEVADWDWGRGDNHLALSGGLMLQGSHALDVTATSVLDLRLLGAFTGVARPAGRADAQIRLGGTATEPTIDGFVTFTNGELRMAEPRLIVSDLAGTVTFARDTLRLERLWASVNGGGTEIAGSLRHQWLKPLDGAITLHSRDAAIEIAGLRAEADADLTLTLEPRGPLVSGTATLVRSSYREPLSLTGGLLQALRASSTPVPLEPSPLDDVRLDIRVTTGDDLLVDNNYARLAASADLRVGGTAAQPVPIGHVALAEGGTIFLGGNRYRIDGQGSIDFTNPTIIEPDLDLRAVTQVNSSDGTVQVALELKGTPTTLQTNLTSSNQPNLSQSDLVSLLVTGRRPDETTTSGYTPGAELLGYLSGELFGTAARAIGLDLVRIERGSPNLRFDAGLIASETDPSARLTFGKNIGSSTQVVFSQSLRESGGLTWIVSYAPRPQAELRAVALDSGDRSYDFRHDVVFGQRRAAPARTPVPQPRVSGVRISGAGADEQALRKLLRLDAGDRFSFFRWQDDRDRLEAFYHDRDRAEARVTTRRSEESADGSATEISYDVRPGPRTGVVIEGFAFPSHVTAALKTAWTHAVIDEFLIDEAEGIVRGALVDRGYFPASVTATLNDASNGKQLRIIVDPGPHSSSRRIVFEGNQHLSSEQLQAAIRDPETARAVWLHPDRVRDRLVALYRSEGYLNADVRLAGIALEGPVATRTISIREGEAFQLRRVHVDGVNALPIGEITTASALAPGGMFSQGLIERARRAIAQTYRQQGFNSVTVTLRTEAVPDRPEVDIALTVEEGVQQRVRDIVTTGLVRTRPELVARALQLEVGQPVSLAAWSSARRRLYETGAFRSVEIEPEPMAAGATPPPSGEEPIRARVRVEEWPAVRLRYGLEAQDKASGAGDAGRDAAPEPASGGGRTVDLGFASDLTFRNLLGRTASAGIAGRYTRDFRAARTYLTAPSLFRLPVTSIVSLSRSREQFGNAGDTAAVKYVSDLTTLTFEQRVIPLPKLEVSYRYGFERNHTFELNPDPLNFFPYDVTVNVARVATGALFDTRNDLVDATRGWFHSSDFEYAPTSLGSDVRFIRYLLQQRYYRTIGPVVLAGAGRLGLATAFGQELIPSARFFAGGGNSVRGYTEDELSPHSVLGFATGGAGLIVLNGEARFPIFKMVRGVGFFDAGRAFEEVKGIALSDLSAGTGVGLRVQTPVVLLRIDVGFPLDSSFGPRRGRWFFSVGQAF